MDRARLQSEQPAPFGALLRRYRLAAGLSQEALAERAGLSVQGLGALENGRRQAPYRHTVGLLAEALGLDAAQRAAFEAARARRGAPAVGGAAGGSPVPGVPPLVGREREVALLERHLAGEGPPVLLLAGEPGIGKTRLLQAAMDCAPAHGWRVLDGGCQRRGGQDPYAPLLGALQRYLRGRSPAQARADLQGCAWLVRLLPELAGGAIEPLPAWSLASEHEHRLMTEAAVRFLANTAGPAGTLLVLDDLQWAGPEALELLATLVRSAEAPLRVIGAYRDSEVGASDPLSALLADLAHAGLVTRCLVAPLPHDDAAVLLNALLTETNEALTMPQGEILRRAGGVPFFLVSWAQAVRQDEYMADDAALPWTVAQSVLQRLHALPESAREVLGVAAVIGRVAPRGLLAAIVTQLEDELLAGLDAACGARLLEEHGSDAYRFVHDVIREAVEADLGAARRAALHRRVAEALERRPGQPPAELLAYHYSCTGEHLKAGHWLERAGDEAASGFANATAIAHYSAARERLAVGGAEAVALSRLDEKLGNLWLLTGAPQQAQAAFARAAASMPHPGRRVEVLCKESEAWTKQGAYDRALEVLAAAEQGAGLTGPMALTDMDAEEAGRAAGHRKYPAERHRLPARLRASVELARGEVQHRRGHYEAAQVAAERAIALLAKESPGTTRDRVLAQATFLRGNVAIDQGDWAQADESLRRSLALRERLDDQHGIAVVTHRLADVAWNRFDFTAAEEYHRRGLAIAERIGDQFTAGRCWRGLGVIAASQSDWTAAEDYHRRAMAIQERIGDQEGLGWAWIWIGDVAFEQHHLLGQQEMGHEAWIWIGDVAFEQGNLTRAEENYRRGLTILECIGQEGGIGWSWWRLSRVASARHDLAEAEQLCQRALISLERTGDRQGMAYAYRDLGYMAGARGDLVAAEERYRRALELWERAADRVSSAWAWWGLGLIALRRGDLVAAERCLAAAPNLREETAAQGYIAASHLLQGWIDQARGNLDVAATRFRQTRRLARRHGFDWLAAQAVLSLGWTRLRAGRLRAAALLAAHVCSPAPAYPDQSTEATLLLAEVQAQRGALAEARAAADTALGLGTREPRAEIAARARHILGLCALAQGVHTEAETHLRVALGLWSGKSNYLEAARARVVLAQALAAQAGDGPVPDEARSLLAEAMSQFATSGAALDLAQAKELAATWRDRMHA